MRQRTAMYFDGDASSAHLWSFFSGKSWAERDAGKPGAGTAFTEGFQQWIISRFPFSHSIPWGRTLLFLSLGYADRSLKIFFEYFDLFQLGEPPHSPSTTAQAMLHHIAAEHGPVSEELADCIKRKIAPF